MDIVNKSGIPWVEAEKKSVLVEGKYPVASLKHIIKSKEIANREKDRAVLPMLKRFAGYKREHEKKMRESMNK